MFILKKAPQRYVGGIVDVVHDADLINGSLVGLGARNSDGQYTAVVPATADLGTKEYLIAYQDELIYEAGFGVEDFTNKAGIPFKAYHLQVGNLCVWSADEVTGTPVVGQYLVPADGQTAPAAAADLIGGTRLAFEVLETDAVIKAGSYKETDGVLARVIKA